MSNRVVLILLFRRGGTVERLPRRLELCPLDADPGRERAPERPLGGLSPSEADPLGRGGVIGFFVPCAVRTALLSAIGTTISMALPWSTTSTSDVLDDTDP